MDGISIPNTRLPPGFRFHPTDQELIIYYLKNKVSPSPTPVVSMMADIDLYKFNPWELPGKAFFGESEWFFFSPRDRKYPNGARPNRAAASGYWKATGTDKPILASSGSQCLGVKKALVFYIGRPPKGMKTNWMMLEYRLLDDAPRSTRIKGSMRLDDWVLCRVRQKSNNPSQIDEQHESLFSSPPYNHRNMEDQAIMKRNDLLEPSDCHFLATRTGSQEGGAVEGCGSISSQRTSKVPIQDMGPQSQALQDMLESIKRTLSIGALDEEQESVPPTKRLNTSTSDNLDGTDMKEGSFYVGSSSNPYAFRGP